MKRMGPVSSSSRSVTVRNRKARKRIVRAADHRPAQRWTESLEARLLLSGSEPYISEFLAINNNSVRDQFGEYSDWIEIHNPATAPVDLAGWSLTDDPLDLAQWQFPSVSVPAGGYLVVFASQRDIRTGSELHTSFRLDGDGEYLALVRPDGTIASDYAPIPQQPDIAFGIPAGNLVSSTLVPSGAAAKALVPTSSNFPTNFRNIDFDDSAWKAGVTGIGFERQSGYEGLIGLDVGEMYNRTGVALVRIPFSVDDASSFTGLTLRMKYDDGFIAYLNGEKVAERNPNTGTLAWNSTAGGDHNDAAAVVFEDIDISTYRTRLASGGGNVLAIVGLNNGTRSTDMLILPELKGSKVIDGPAEPGMLATPTPGQPNFSAVMNLGPIIDAVSHAPNAPLDSEDLTVTAQIRPWQRPVTGATLTYRVQFGAEVSRPMFDDGLHGDGGAGDGLWGAVIPASAASAGQMLRYFVTATDAQNRTSRAPLFATPSASAQYFGTVIQAGLTSTLPILYWFVQDTNAAEGSGTRASVFYDCDGAGPEPAEFYDNIFVRHRGGYSTDGTKFDFNPGEHFKFSPDHGRVEEFNINYRGALDDAYIRPVIGMETFRDAGSPASMSFPIRVQQNGNFYGVGIYIEQVDEDYFARQGYDGDGSLYKMTQDRPQMLYASDFEQKNPRNGDRSDLQAFLNGIHLTGAAQTQYLFDHVDIFSFLNYQAAMVLTADNDAAQKNYYLYHNPDTDLWMIIPWDKDLTFGKNYGIGDYQQRDPQAHPFFADSNHPKIDGPGAYNFLIDALLDNPTIKQIYLRRLRTVMDQLLQPSSTPYPNRYYEKRLDELYPLLMGDPAFKAQAGDLKGAFDAIKNNYLTPRRQHLYVDHSTNPAYPDFAGIPGAQNTSPRIDFGAFDFNPASGDQRQEYIELRNPNNVAVDLAGWRLTGGVDFTFPKGVVIPASGSLYVSPNVISFRARTTGPRGGQGLLVTGPYDEQLSARGETVQLMDPYNAPISFLTYPGNPTTGQRSLRITEVMYNPPDTPGEPVPGNDRYEYVELQNIGPDPLNLAGFRFTQGIDYAFDNLTLAAGQYVVVARDPAAFAARYGTVPAPVVGPVPTKRLDNEGDRIQLLDPVGEVVLDFRFEDEWYWSTDHLGRSLVIRDPAAAPGMWDLAAGWRPSANDGGSPGDADPAPETTPPTVTLAPIQPNPRNAPVDTLQFVFSEPVAGLDPADISLSRDGGPNLLADLQALTTLDHITWTLGGLASLTTEVGTYSISLKATDSGITDASGNALEAGLLAPLFIERTAPQAFITMTIDDTRPVETISITFSEPITGFDRSDLVLSRDGGPNLLTDAQTLTASDSMYWTLGNLAPITSISGSYVLTLRAEGSGIADLAGNPLAEDRSINFTLDLESPTATFLPVQPNPRNAPVDAFVIVFSEPVSNLRAIDVDLIRNGLYQSITLGNPRFTTSDRITWILSGLSQFTDRPGSYSITFDMPNSIRDDAGRALGSVAGTTWSVDTLPPTASFEPIATPRTDPLDSATLIFNEPVLGLDLSRFSLTLSGGPNLLTGAQSLVQVDDLTWRIDNLAPLTTASGQYTLMLNADDLGITDLAGNVMAYDPFRIFVVDKISPTVTIGAPILGNYPRVYDIPFTFSEPVKNFDVSDLTLTREGGENLLTPQIELRGSNRKDWTLRVFPVTWRLGEYVITLNAENSGITDDSGNPLTQSPSRTFVVDTIVADMRVKQWTDSITLSVDAADPSLGRVSAPGFDEYTYRLADLNSLTIMTVLGSDSITLDFSNGDPLPASGITIDGGFDRAVGGDFDQLRLVGASADDPFTVTANAVARAGKIITVKEIETLQLAQGAFLTNLAPQPASPIGLSVDAQATVTFTATQSLPSLEILSGGVARIASAGDRALVLNALTISDAGRLDVTDNALIVQAVDGTAADALDQVERWLRTGYADGAWTGPGINSSTAAGDESRLSGVGVMLSDREQQFAGQPVNTNSILVKHTWNGDTDLNGTVDADDYFRADRGRLKNLGGYANGDIDHSGAVTADDYQLIDAAFRRPLPVPPAPARAIPALAAPMVAWKPEATLFQVRRKISEDRENDVL